METEVSMFTTEMALILPLILLMIMSIVFLLVYIVNEDMIEIQSNTNLYQEVYSATVNGKSAVPSGRLMIEKGFEKRTFILPQQFEMTNPKEYAQTSERSPEFMRYNPRVFLLIKNGFIRVINRGEE